MADTVAFSPAAMTERPTGKSSPEKKSQFSNTTPWLSPFNTHSSPNTLYTHTYRAAVSCPVHWTGVQQHFTSLHTQLAHTPTTNTYVHAHTYVLTETPN